MATWYTQPPKKNDSQQHDELSSFYYYDPNTRDFVRIRLELNRDDGGPFIESSKHWYVGFSSIDLIDVYNELGKAFPLTVREGKVLYNGNGLLQWPDCTWQQIVGCWVLDFPLMKDGTPDMEALHFGNCVAEHPNLPTDSKGVKITEQNLVDLARKFSNTELTNLTRANSSEAALADRILELLK